MPQTSEVVENTNDPLFPKIQALVSWSCLERVGKQGWWLGYVFLCEWQERNLHLASLRVAWLADFN